MYLIDQKWPTSLLYRHGRLKVVSEGEESLVATFPSRGSLSPLQEIVTDDHWQGTLPLLLWESMTVYETVTEDGKDCYCWFTLLLLQWGPVTITKHLQLFITERGWFHCWYGCLWTLLRIVTHCQGTPLLLKWGGWRLLPRRLLALGLYNAFPTTTVSTVLHESSMAKELMWIKGL